MCGSEGGGIVIVTTIDPVTGYKVLDPEHHPFVVEGSGMAAIKIYLMALPDDPSHYAKGDPPKRS